MLGTLPNEFIERRKTLDSREDTRFAFGKIHAITSFDRKSVPAVPDVVKNTGFANPERVIVRVVGVSDFTVAIQRAESQTAEDSEEKGNMTATILLVDGDSANRTDWEALLQNHGYKVIAANNGNAVLQECRRIQPDLVLMSGALQGLSGYEVCRRLKANPKTRSTPVVMMLPSADISERVEGLAAGADDFWGRPGSRWEALSRVQAILQIESYIDHQAEAVVVSLARSLELKHRGTEGHSERLVGYALQLGKSLELPEDELEVLRIACLVHDIGKVGVPDSILLKPGRLNESEMAVMRQHPVYGESICAPLKAFRDALPIIRHHHERMDGSGYPDGLIGDRIPVSARILQIADIYDALTTDRTYRQALPHESAVAVMQSEAHRGWLSPSLLGKFIDICAPVEFLPPPRDSYSAIHPV